MNKQNIKLAIMILFGLPGLSYACVMWVVTWIVANPRKKFTQALSKEEFIAHMDVGTISLLMFLVIRHFLF